MAKKLYVGGLPYSTTKEELEELFAGAGVVESAAVILDRDTKESKGFGFIEMATEEEAEKAITMFNEFDLGGRKLKVNEARPQEERRPMGGGNQGGGYNRNRY